MKTQLKEIGVCTSGRAGPGSGVPPTGNRDGAILPWALLAVGCLWNAPAIAYGEFPAAGTWTVSAERQGQFSYEQQMVDGHETLAEGSWSLFLGGAQLPWNQPRWGVDYFLQSGLSLGVVGGLRSAPGAWRSIESWLVAPRVGYVWSWPSWGGALWVRGAPFHAGSEAGARARYWGAGGEVLLLLSPADGIALTAGAAADTSLAASVAFVPAQATSVGLTTGLVGWF